MRLTPFAPFVLFLGAAASAQAVPLPRQIEFIRALARDLGLVTLAQEETDRLLKAKLSSDEFKTVAQLGVEISLYGAKGIRNDREKQRTLFKDALDRSKEFIDRYRGDAAALPAQTTLAEACYEYGKFLADETEIARTDTPDKVKDYEEQAAQVFQLGKDTCEEVMTALASAAKTDNDAKLKHGVAWLRKGILLREHARAVKKDRVYLAEAARNTLEELAITWGEETVLGMRAMFEGSQVDEVLGNPETAAENYRGTIEAIFEALNEQELPPSARELLGLMLQEAYDRLTAAELSLGKNDAVLAAVDEFDKRLKKLDAEEDTRFGHSVRLNHARALAESGDKTKVSEALKSAARINDLHPTDVIGLKAKNIIRDILTMQSSLVSGELLYQVALGDFQSRRYEPAVQGFKRAIAALSPEESKKLGLAVYVNLGKTFGAQARPLEAVVAIKTGLARYPSEDPIEASEAGRLLERAMTQVRQLTKNDPAFDALNAEVTALAAAVGGPKSQDKINWATANDLMTQSKFAEAADLFGKITEESPYYELALVRQVQAWKSGKQADKALSAAAAYRKWREGAGQTSKTTTTRPQAEAELEFHLGSLAYLQATGDIGGKKDQTKFQTVVSTLSDFPDRFGKTSPGLVPHAYDLLARSHIELGARDKAEEAYRSLAKAAADSPLVPRLSAVIFNSHLENVKALSLELDAAIKSSSPKVKEIGAKLTAARRATVAFGRDYANSATDPQYSILYIALQNADELRDWNLAQEFANKLVATFANHPTHGTKVDLYVRPVLGKILLRQQKYVQAYDMLVAAEKQMEAGGKMVAAAFPVKRLICQALGGWRDVDARGDVVPYGGLEKPAEAYEKQWNEVKKYALTAKVKDFSIEWYEFHWEAYLYANLASQKDSKYRSLAERLYNIARATDNFETLKGLGARGEELFTLFRNTPIR